MYRSFDLAKEFGIHIQAYTDHAVVSESDNHHLRKYLSVQNLGVILIDDIRTYEMAPSIKLLGIDYDDPSRVDAFRAFF